MNDLIHSLQRLVAGSLPSDPTAGRDQEAILAELHNIEEVYRYTKVRRRRLMLDAREAGATTRQIASKIGVTSAAVSVWSKQAREEMADSADDGEAVDDHQTVR